MKEVLHLFDSEDAVNQKEIELVTEASVSDTQSYTVGIGGEGGPPFKGKHHTPEVKEKLRCAALLRDRELTPETRQLMRHNHWARSNPEDQQLHAKTAGATASKNSDKIRDTLKAYYATHASKVTGTARSIVVCPHCDKEDALDTMVRWHFDNCKNPQRGRGVVVFVGLISRKSCGSNPTPATNTRFLVKQLFSCV